MRKRKWITALAVLALAVCALPLAVSADTPAEMDFKTFLAAVEASNYQYDGQGVTVRWSPSSACTDNRENHTCLFADGSAAHQPDGNNCQRIQTPNAQYQIFSGQGDVSISNVNFVFEPADFTLCMNSNWEKTATAEAVRNAEFQLLNTGSVTFTGCTFDKVIVSPFSSTTKTTITGCRFSNVYDAYAIKDIRSPAADINGCTFTNCGGGVYFEGAVAKTAINISGNTFTNIDQYAVEEKKGTRGLIQFSASGDYSAAAISITSNTATGGAAVVRQLNTTLTENKLALDALEENNTFDGELLTSSTYGTNTVYYNGRCFDTLANALTAVYTSSPTATAKVYCKAGADVGAMTHSHVADDLVIYGNGAKVTGGEYDLEIDTYKFDRATGKQSDSGEFLTKDITVAVYDLDGIAAWGQRNTDKTVNLTFVNCKNMNRVYFTNTANDQGKINITLKDCSFDAVNGTSNKNTSVYSNAAGDITITDTTFTGIAVGLNINHKSPGVQNILLDGCTFTDCAVKEDAVAQKAQTYAAPVRVVAKEGATTNLTVKSSAIAYSSGKVNSGNGDILLGDGRYDADDTQGMVTLAMTGTAANVMVQKKGYYTDGIGNTVNADNAAATAVTVSDELVADADNHFVVKKPAPKPEEPWTPTPTATPAPGAVLDSTPKTGAVSLAVLPLAALAFAGLGVAAKRRQH